LAYNEIQERTILTHVSLFSRIFLRKKILPENFRAWKISGWIFFVPEKFQSRIFWVRKNFCPEFFP